MPSIPVAGPPTKSILASKTFWLNVLGVAAMLQPFLPLPPATAAYVLAGLNIANRFLTVGPVSFTGNAS